jgi:protein TonB
MAGFTSEDLLDQPEGLASPFAQSFLLHGLIVGALIGYAYVHNMLHGSEWGANAFQQGAIQATLVSTAALPLPQDHPPTDNVLATETPSVAPALEEQKTEPLPLPEAIPIPEKQAPAKPEPKPVLSRSTRQTTEKQHPPTFPAPLRATTAPIAPTR